MLKEQRFNADAVTLNFAEGPPSGPPLVLLHGGGNRWQEFLPIIPSLVTRWHLYALDFRGHGKSGRLPGQYRPDHYAADVVAFLERQLTDPAILFGESFGGWIALMCAAQHAEKVRALILGDPPLCMERFVAMESREERIRHWRSLRDLAGSRLSVPERAAALAALPSSVLGQEGPVRHGDLPGMDTAQLRGWAKSLEQADPDALQYHVEGRLDEYVAKIDVDAALRRITCPVLLLQADPLHGGLVADEDVDHVLSLLTDGVHVRLEGAGHGLGLSTWEVAPLLRAVTAFLESL